MVSRKQFVLDIRKVILIGLIAVLLALLTDAHGASKRFYPDDPLWREPAPRPTEQVKLSQVDELYDFIENRFVTPAQESDTRKLQAVPAGNVNTLGEVPDSSWYTNRHWRQRMSIAELQRGSGNAAPPEADGTWQIVSAKSDGITPGLVIEDRQRRRYVLKFDPPDFPELASAADIISSKFFYALGYNTPENYIVHFRRDNLTIAEGLTWRDAHGKRRLLTPRAVDEMLHRQPKDSSGAYRALASRWIGGDLVALSTTRGLDPTTPTTSSPMKTGGSCAAACLRRLAEPHGREADEYDGCVGNRRRPPLLETLPDGLRVHTRQRRQFPQGYLARPCLSDIARTIGVQTSPQCRPLLGRRCDLWKSGDGVSAAKGSSFEVIGLDRRKEKPPASELIVEKASRLSSGKQ
jgi:hypothetical protein